MIDSMEKKDITTESPALDAEAIIPSEEVEAEEKIAVVPVVDAVIPETRRTARRPGRERRRPQGNRGRGERKSEFDQRLINIRRVARVVAGGRRFSFSVSIIIGNKKG